MNLTAANYIFLVELLWNPSVEKQAIARAIRLGQKDKVIVTRYLMLGTVEEQIQGQQVNKHRAAKAGFKGQDARPRDESERGGNVEGQPMDLSP